MLIAVITAGLVALFIRLTSVDRLLNLIVDQQRSSLQTVLTKYYQVNGSWDGIAEEWPQIRQQIARPPMPETPGLFSNNQAPPPSNEHQEFFGLADAQGKVLIAFNPMFAAGAETPPEVLQGGTPILLNGEHIGTILNPPLRPRFNPAEDLFLQRTTEALIYAVLGAMGVALLIGVLLARTLIRPLQALTRAAQSITQGELEQAVKVTSRDEIGQLALAFNKMSREVARVNQLRRQMTADIAHDLRTPLMVIAGYVESMQEGVLLPTQERLKLIYTEIERLQRLVGDLRMLSQVDAGELSLKPQPVSPKDFLERVMATFTQQAEAQAVTLSVNTPASVPFICVDEARLMQVFSNLLSNSLRYTPPGGNIRLSAEARDGQSADAKVTLTVWDNGAGIPAEDLPNIFDRFYRVDKSRSEAGETGLGLAIVKALVKAQSGEVWVESNLGEFTAFHITFPRN